MLRPQRRFSPAVPAAGNAEAGDLLLKCRRFTGEGNPCKVCDDGDDSAPAAQHNGEDDDGQYYGVQPSSRRNRSGGGLSPPLPPALLRRSPPHVSELPSATPPPWQRHLHSAAFHARGSAQDRARYSPAVAENDYGAEPDGTFASESSPIVWPDATGSTPYAAARRGR
jgi:hypothetical protein